MSRLALAPTRALLVEPDAAAAATARAWLAPAGVEVQTVPSLAEACARPSDARPDVVLVVPASLADEAAARFGELATGGAAPPPVLLLRPAGHAVDVGAATRLGVTDVLDTDGDPELRLLRLRAAVRASRLAQLAELRLDELRFLAETGGRLGRTLRLEDVLAEAVRAFERFAPSVLFLLQLDTDGPPTLRTYGARRPAFDDPTVQRVIEGSRAAFSAHVEPDEVQRVHTPIDWAPDGEVELCTHAAIAGQAVRTFVAMRPQRPLDEDEAQLFRAIADRVAAPIENARLHRKVVDAHKGLREAFQALGRAQAERLSAERLASVGQLAAGIAHEINNPLAFVLSNLSVCRDYVRDLGRLLTLYRAGDREGAEALADRVDPEFLLADLEPLIEETIEGGNRVHEIVRKLRGFTQVKGPDAVEEINLQAAVESVLNVLHGELRQRVQVRRELFEVPTVRGDRGKLSQVFMNLTMNAANNIPADRDGVVTVRLYSRPGEVAVEFADDGPAIARQRLARIFEPFAAHRDIGRGGLDLAICDEVVRRHNGRIEVTSHEGVGTTFTVWLPGRSTVPLPRIMLEADPEDGPRGHVLFIDDERFLLSAYERAFPRRVNVHLAHGGAEALEQLERLEHIDAVLCDLVMPRINGIDVYGWVSANRPELLERFIVVTGGQQGDRFREFLQRTGLPVVHKPFRVRDLVSVIEPLLPRADAARAGGAD